MSFIFECSDNFIHFYSHFFNSHHFSTRSHVMTVIRGLFTLQCVQQSVVCDPQYLCCNVCQILSLLQYESCCSTFHINQIKSEWRSKRSSIADILFTVTSLADETFRQIHLLRSTLDLDLTYTYTIPSLIISLAHGPT